MSCVWCCFYHHTLSIYYFWFILAVQEGWYYFPLFTDKRIRLKEVEQMAKPVSILKPA